MNYTDVHGVKLPIPSFFQVYNYGGGNGDKDREIVYSEFTKDTPALINYFYINNRYPHRFSSHEFDNISKYNRVGDLYNNIRSTLKFKKKVYNGYLSPEYDFNDKVFLLDSGAYNIVKQIAQEIEYDVSKFKAVLFQHMKDYYDFADQLKVDIVVSFDLGGKYTHKDNEKKDWKLKHFLDGIDTDEINNYLLENTITYLAARKDYYPLVLATVHGATMIDYSACVDNILYLEKKYDYKFWGFALGGIASYRQVDSSWYKDICFDKIGKRGFIETVVPARACRIVRKKVADRPIHALGCGGYANIAMNYYCGATSFDAASPARRVGDGNFESTKLVFNPKQLKDVKFSKYFIGGINDDDTLRPGQCKYVNLNKIEDEMPLCGCPACLQAGTIKKIKELYAMKETDAEANYFSRQLIGLHAVMQHRKLCEMVSKYKNFNDFCDAFPSDLNKGLKEVYRQL